MAIAAPPPTQTSHASAGTKPFPSALAPVAVLLAVVVAALSLLPSPAQAVWELPHLFLLGLVISYGVFAHSKNSAGDDGDADKDAGARAWNSRYHPDDPLVVVADHALSDDGEDYAGRRPFSLPVRRLKPVAEEATTGGASDDGMGEETDSSASTAGFWAGAPAAPSPPSVLDAFNPPEFDASTPSTTPKGSRGYEPLVSPRDQSFDEDDDEDATTDWEEEADGSTDEMTASSEWSFRDEFIARSNRGDGDSVDDELLELAKKAGPEGEDEVDRKADEFIAKFREQIRMQRMYT